MNNINSILVFAILSFITLFFLKENYYTKQLSILDTNVHLPLFDPINISQKVIDEKTINKHDEEIKFPSSPIMPHLNVIEGVAPFNPEFIDNDWSTTVPNLLDNITTDDPVKYATTIRKDAIQVTPAPNSIPIPTMYPSPTNPNKISFPERFISTFDKYNGYTNQPMIISGLDKPINSIMSRWSQFGPCSNGSQERTRTCIHNGISGGKTCTHTRETRIC